jgi:hypothetical protein
LGKEAQYVFLNDISKDARKSLAAQGMPVTPGDDLWLVQGFFLPTLDASRVEAALRLSIYHLEERTKVLRAWRAFLPPGLTGVCSQRLLPQGSLVAPSLRGVLPWWQALILPSREMVKIRQPSKRPRKPQPSGQLARTPIELEF